MFARPTEIELDRLQIAGLDLTPEQAETLARQVEADIRLLVAAGNTMAVSADEPIETTTPPDIPALAQAVAVRVWERVAHG